MNDDKPDLRPGHRRLTTMATVTDRNGGKTVQSQCQCGYWFTFTCTRWDDADFAVHRAWRKHSRGGD